MRPVLTKTRAKISKITHLLRITRINIQRTITGKTKRRVRDGEIRRQYATKYVTRLVEEEKRNGKPYNPS